MKNLMIYINILIVFLLVFYSCSDKETKKYAPPKSHNTIELKEKDVKKIILNSNDFANNKIFNLKEEKHYVGTWNFAHQKNDKYFFISPDNCTIIILEKSGKFITGFSVKGNGLGFLKVINASVITDNSIILYDSSLRKFVEYDFGGRFIREYVNDGSSLPYHISGIAYNKPSFFCVGIDNDGYEAYSNKKVYTNLFEIDIYNQKLINKYSIIPDNFEEYLKSNDIAANPVSNPFNITLIKNKIYVFDWVSGQINYFVLNDINSLTKIKLSNDLFPKHFPLTMDKNNSKLSNEWFKSGAYLNNIFEDNNFLMLYITIYNNHTNKIDKNILFIDKESMNLKYIISTDEEKHLKFVEDNKLIFTGYDNPEAYESGIITVYKLDYKKLF